MRKGEDRIVYRRDYGIWVNKINNGKKATSLHKSQVDAINSAKKFLKKHGGGVLTVKDIDGRIRSKDTILPGDD